MAVFSNLAAAIWQVGSNKDTSQIATWGTEVEAHINANESAVASASAAATAAQTTADANASNKADITYVDAQIAALGGAASDYAYEVTGNPDQFPTSWGVLSLNTVRSETGSSLSSSQIMLTDAGVYEIVAYVQVYNVSGGGRSSAIRLYNVSQSTVLINGSGVTAQNVSGHSHFLAGRFSVLAGEIIELQGRASGAGVFLGADVSPDPQAGITLQIKRVS